MCDHARQILEGLWQQQAHERMVAVQSSTGVPGGWYSWASFLPSASVPDGALAPHSPRGDGMCLQPPFVIGGWKATPAPCYGHDKTSFRKKERCKVMALNLRFTCRLPPDLNYFSFSFINNSVGVWGAHLVSCFQFNGSYMLAGVLMSTIMIHESLVCQKDPECVLHTLKLGVDCAHSAEITILCKEIQLPISHIGEERQEHRLKSNFFPLWTQAFAAT